MIPVLGVLHLSDLNYNPKMKLLSLRNWQKVSAFLSGTWPQPVPSRHVWNGEPCNLWSILEPAFSAPYVAVDTEYHPESGTISILGVGWAGGGFQATTPALRWARSELTPVLGKLFRSVPVVFQNSMADIPIIETAFGIGYNDYHSIEDTMLAHAVLWSELPHDLEFLAAMYGMYPKMKHLRHADPLLYNWGDVVDTMAVWNGLVRELSNDPEAEAVYRDQSLALVPLLLERKRLGVRINQARIASAAAELRHTITETQQLAEAYEGWPVNLASPAQLQFVLYTDERMPVQKAKGVTHKKKPTINKDAISTLRARYLAFDAEEEKRLPLGPEAVMERIDQGGHPLLEARAAFAYAQQMYSHYIEPAEGRGRFYPQIKIHAQETGRWSIDDPPLAQLPSGYRDILIPDPGMAWVSWDWDQIELRILAALAQDEPLLTAFVAGWDVHTLNACDLFGLVHPANRIDPHQHPANAVWRQKTTWLGKDDQRRVFAKRFVYRLMYGGEAKSAGDIPGAKALALGATELVMASNRFLSAHPSLNAWWRSIREMVMTSPHPESRSFMGRRRRFLSSSGSAVIREAYNHPMQASVVDILNLTLLALKRIHPEMTLVYTMHDSATIEVPSPRAVTMYESARAVLNTPWEIYGRSVRLPATMNPVKYGGGR